MVTWGTIFRTYWQSEKGQQLEQRVNEAYRQSRVFPPRSKIFTAFELTPYDKVRVVILGQDPYHGEGQAQGLAFSVPKGMKLPPSLQNIYKELSDDLAVPVMTNGDLSSWARQGVLLLNTVLTVEAHRANSHQMFGWQDFTDTIIQALNARPEQIIFVLWGKPAQQKKFLITGSQHKIIHAPHPSPLSAYRGFFGSRPFSKINRHLDEPIDWLSVSR